MSTLMRGTILAAMVGLIGPATLTPFYPQLLVVSAAGDFEGYLIFGIGLAAQGPYHVSTLTGPHRVVIDVDHVAPGSV